jgi:hypothetical protein
MAFFQWFALRHHMGIVPVLGYNEITPDCFPVMLKLQLITIPISNIKSFLVKFTYKKCIRSKGNDSKGTIVSNCMIGAGGPTPFTLPVLIELS